MAKAPHGHAAPSCEHCDAADSDGWHALVCTTRSGPAITERHHAVVRLLAAAAARRLVVPARMEPHHLCEDDERRSATSWTCLTGLCWADHQHPPAPSAGKLQLPIVMRLPLPFVLHTYDGLHPVRPFVHQPARNSARRNDCAGVVRLLEERPPGSLCGLCSGPAQLTLSLATLSGLRRLRWRGA